MNTCYQLRKVGLPASVEKVKNFYRLTSSTTIIGRGQSVDIFLDSSIRKGLISRAHAQIIQSEGEEGVPVYSIFDTSLNGTYVNDRRVKGSIVLKEGDTVAFGHLCGSKILPGALGPQKETEFLFKFEKCLHPEVKDEPVDLTERELSINSSSVFMSPKSPLAENGSSLLGLQHLSDPEPPVKRIKQSLSGSLYESNDEEIIYMEDKVKSDDDGSFCVDLDDKVSDVASEEVLSSAPQKPVHPRNKVISLPQMNNNNNNVKNYGRNGNGSHNGKVKNTLRQKSDRSRGKRGMNDNHSDGSDAEVESESEYMDSDSDSEKSEEIPDESSDSEFMPKGGRLSGKRKPTTASIELDNRGARPSKLNKMLPKVCSVANTNSKSKSDPKVNAKCTSNFPGKISCAKKSNNNSKDYVRPRSINDYKTVTKRDYKKEKNKKGPRKEPKKSEAVKKDNVDELNSSGTNGYTHDKCDAPKCKIPSGSLKTITWIQCDDCDAWYHVSCSGLSVSAAKKEDTIFRCGCA